MGTVQAMIWELLFSCNVEHPVPTCCHFHAALSALRRTIVEFGADPCKGWSPEGTTRGQCPECGVLVYMKHSKSTTSVRTSCAFCDCSLSSSFSLPVTHEV